MSLDLIISTADTSHNFPISDYLSMLWINGSFIAVGLPDDDLPPVNAFTLLNNGSKIGGSHIGTKEECIEMLKLAAEKGVKPWYVFHSISSNY